MVSCPTVLYDVADKPVLDTLVFPPHLSRGSGQNTGVLTSASGRQGRNAGVLTSASGRQGQDTGVLTSASGRQGQNSEVLTSASGRQGHQVWTKWAARHAL